MTSRALSNLFLRAYSFVRNDTRRRYWFLHSQLKGQVKEIRPAKIMASFTNGHSEDSKILNESTLNPRVKLVEYAVRGPIVARALAIEKELKQGVKKPFTSATRANIGDCHAVGMKPNTFIRQTLAACVHPEILEFADFPEDVVRRSKQLVSACNGGSVGSYSASPGVELIRRDVANYITERDGIPANWEDVFMITGASDGIRTVMKLVLPAFNAKKPVGVMIPIPQYPLYSASVAEFGAHQVSYYLNEDDGWSLEVKELRRAVKEARTKCDPKVLCVINPGNPTGQVLTRKNIEEIIRFAKEENLLLLADEVYQTNIWGEKSEFHSFKKVMMEMGPEYHHMELASFHSMSKGWHGECGLRGGYMEIINLDPYIKGQLTKLISTKLCPPTLGQCAMAIVCKEPKPGDPSHENFKKEKQETLDLLKKKAKLVAETFNSIPGISCNEVTGAMYAFPRIDLPPKAIQAAKEAGQTPDTFYCFRILEEIGLCVVPGSGFGQRPGTYHFRMTILPPLADIEKNMNAFKDFHMKFIEKYS